MGPYEILDAIGAGGMGEVYRARDTKLGRNVALKVLPAAFASDPERMARFRREAQVLASLNHPHIGAIYGFEDSGSVHALVMELIEGPTLADRIAHGAILLDDALPIAQEIAEALEAAHERGIVHRDLKPANIKITPEGNVKVLDFGLAKAIEGDATSTDIQNSPTISRMATQAGIILGTAAYMSPEQAKGKSVDRRTDIWAFGCVLYEMLTGRHAFEGETVTDTLAAVIRAEPDWTLLPSKTPQTIRSLLQRCLTKDSKQRLQSIGEARIAIEDILSGSPDAAPSAGAPRELTPQNKWLRALPWAALAVVLAVTAGLFAAGYIARAPRPLPAIVSQITPPADEKFVFAGTSPAPPALSPDGQRLAFSAVSLSGRQLLWVRPLNSSTAKPLEGTDGAILPFWSPDSQYLGFFANGKLNRIDASGSPSIALCDATTSARGGAWGRDGTILFTPTLFSPLFRVPASGGAPEPVTKLNESVIGRSHRWPQFLPDGNHFLFFAQAAGSEIGNIYAASLGGGEFKLLFRNVSAAVYTSPGYLLFVRQGTLMAQRFEASKLLLIGDAVPLAEHVAVNDGINRAIFAVSENGILTYQAGEDRVGIDRLLWFDRSGKQSGQVETSDFYFDPSISYDGRKLAVSSASPGSSIWVLDLTRGTTTRLTFSSGNDWTPTWAPDGTSIVFASNQNGEYHIYKHASDGTGTTIPLVVDDASDTKPTFSADGRYLLFGRFAAQIDSQEEIWALPLSGDRKPFPVIQNRFAVADPALSPNGKWLAHTSNESGRLEIYVVPFLQGAGKWQISTTGGSSPHWRHDGRELFYLSADNKIMSAEIGQQSSLQIGKVQALFQANPISVRGTVYDVSGDGHRFIVATPGAQQDAQPLTLVSNWPALLKKP